MTEHEAGTIVAIGASGVPIEVELACQDPIVVIAASIEPRVRGLYKVRIVSVNGADEKATELVFTTYNLHLFGLRHQGVLNQERNKCQK